jgi:hypothetical protein
LLPAAGIALATAFAAAVVTVGAIAQDQAARTSLGGQSALARTLRVTWQGPLTPTVAREARSLFAAVGLGEPAQVTLLTPVRLDGIVVRPAAIAPLAPWLAPGEASAAAVSRCTAAACPMLLAGGSLASGTRLGAAGVRISISGDALLRSAAPLGFSPPGANNMPVLLSGDPAGLAGVAGLSGVFRTRQWVAVLPAKRLRAWSLAAFERRLTAARAALLADNGQFSVSAPFIALDAARAEASAAPNRLLPAGGGALAALLLFLVLAIGGLRQDLAAELARLRTAGARPSQCAVLVAVEASLLTAVAVLIGGALAVGVSLLLASASGEPVGGALEHGIFTADGIAVLAGGWGVATLLVAALLTVDGRRAADLAAGIAIAALAVALAVGSGANASVAVMLAPLCCLAAGVIVYRAMASALPLLERVARRGPLAGRLSLVALARNPPPASLAIAFITVSIGLGGFALSYRATLERGAADEAANSVPLDAIVAPGQDFASPLALASQARWQALAGGPAWPVRRTYASYAIGYGTATVPILGVPAAALAGFHGWRQSDGSAPLSTLARRLAAGRPERLATAPLPVGASTISIPISSHTLFVSVTADLRLPDGLIRRVALRQNRPTALGATPAGTSLEALELDEPTGLTATNGHQNGENVAAATQSSGQVVVGPVSAGGRTISLAGWHAIGAAGRARGAGPDRVAVRFDDSGEPGIVRPVQATDGDAIPVLVDPVTAAAAGRGGRLALTVDGEPVQARVAGVLRRFPTVGSGAGGFLVADEPTLAIALDSQLPGQGAANELWASTRDPTRLRAALRTASLSHLTASYRAAIERRLRNAPVARAVFGTLLGATIVTGVLAIVGLLVALLGGGRDRTAERDLLEQGIGPGELRRQLRLRLVLAAAIGTCAGLVVAVLLTTLVVAAARAAGTLSAPQPPLIAIAPAGELLLWGVIALVALTATATAAVRAIRWRSA